MQPVNKRLLLFVVLSLILLVTFFIIFVLPQNISPAQYYQGPGSPYVHPPGD